MTVAGHDPAEVRAAARHVLWPVGNLSWALHERQIQDQAHVEAAYARGIRRHVRLCGRRYGKTRGMVVDAYEHAIRTPGARILYASMTWESACSFVFPEAEYLNAHAPAEHRPEIVDGEVRFPNGSRIIVRGCEDQRKANRLRGPRAHRAFVDEAAFIDILDYVIRDVIAAQLLTTDGMTILGSSAPLSPGHPFMQYVHEAERRGALVRARTRDAPHIPQDMIDRYCDELGGPQSSAWLREGEAEVVTDEKRAVIPEWRDHASTIVKEATPRDWRHWYLSADLGYVDLTVILLGWLDWYGYDEHGVSGPPKIVIEDERVLTRPVSSDVQAAALELERRHGVPADRVLARVADAPLITLADMRKHQGRQPDALYWRSPRKDDLEAATNAVRLAVRRHELVIHPRCKTLIADCNDAIWNGARTEFDRCGEVGHFDALAALVYMVRTVDRNRCPEPGAWVPPRNAKVAVGDMSGHRVRSESKVVRTNRRRA